MAKYSIKARDEVPDKHSDNAQRRTRPADIPALSPKAINDLYAKGRLRPKMRAEDHEAPQELGDRNNLRAPNYHNDVPLTGDRAWLRGGGRGGEDNPCFDAGKLDVADKPPIAATLTQMERQARERSNFNQVAAKQRMIEWVRQDRRFDDLEAERVVDRVQHCRQSGAVFDVNDPALRKCGQPRPLAGRYGTGRY